MRPTLALLPALVLTLALAMALPALAAPAESPDLVLEVRLGQHVVTDALGAYQQGKNIYLPLGELARLLTLAVRSDPAGRQASGYILAEQRGFRLDIERMVVLREGRTEAVAPDAVMLRSDDIYVAASQLSQWLPVDLELDLANLLLKVGAREKLPLQARLERQSRAQRGATAGQDGRNFAPAALPYALVEAPFIDQTIALDHRRAAGRHSSAARYAAFATGDLLGMEAALYLSHGNHATDPAARLTLGRHDPEAGLLGPLRARSVQLGSVHAPGLQHIAAGSAPGNGFLLSNRPLSQPTRFDRHTLQGDLAPGWDVELYYNDALLATQQAGADGKYRFEDQPLNYGPNDFRLVFHGPLGQLRVERHSFLLEQTLLLPGDLHYSVSARHEAAAGTRSQAQFDLGLGRQFSASALLASLPVGAQQRRYASLGVHGFWQGFIASASLVRSDPQGKLAQIGMKTRLGGVAVSASRAVSDKFVSELYLPGSAPVRLRDELQLDGVLEAGLGFPLALYARRDRLASGAANIEVSARVSAFRFGTAFSHALRWQSLASNKHADAALQLSRRMAGIGLSAQLHYTLEPRVAMSSLALAADKHLRDGYLVNAALARSYADGQMRYSAGLTRGMGNLGFGISSHYSRREGFGAGVQLFLALGRDSRRGRWMLEAAPLAASGSASARVFLDRNRNGLHDGADEAVPGAGFLINGASSMARTDAQGLAWLGRMAPRQLHDIAIDPTTLEDPRWQALQPGVRLLARPGKTGQLDFAIGITGEIDGNTYLVADGIKRGVGDFEVELVDAAGRVVASATSSSDGYYVMAGIHPGTYTLRLSPAQLARLGMQAPAPLQVRMDDDGNFLNGKDFVVRR